MRTSLLVALVGIAAGASGAMADMVAEQAFYSGVSYSVDMRTGAQVTTGGNSRSDRGTGPVVIQDSLPGNPAPAANIGFSQASALNPRYGDDYIPIAGGNLDQIGISLFNSSSTASGTPTPITAASVNVWFFDALTFTTFGASTPLGNFNAAFNFTSPLNPGFFTTMGVTGIGGLGINVPSTGALMMYQWTVTGSTRHGFVSIATPTVGTSGGTDFYMSGSAAEGFYNLSGTPTPVVNVSMAWVVPAPASASLLALGGLVAARRRRN